MMVMAPAERQAVSLASSGFEARSFPVFSAYALEAASKMDRKWEDWSLIEGIWDMVVGAGRSW